MIITVLTLFPDFFATPLQQTILKRAQEGGQVQYRVVDIRDYCLDKHKTADDTPFGGGPGMVLKPEPLSMAIEDIKQNSPEAECIYLTPKGESFSQQLAESLSEREHLILLCGRYEGIDERIRQHWVDREISIGDYVLSGGEGAALVVMDAIVRLLSGVLGNEKSLDNESFSRYLLDHPHYTKPAHFKGHTVPEVLLSGNHARIEQWRLEQARKETRQRRPDLYQKYLDSLKDEKAKS